MFTQISVLLLYKRVFTLYRPWFRIALGVLTFLALTSNLSVLLVIIFGCSPIEKSWKGFAVEGHCVDLRNLYIAHAALSLVVDLSIVVAPIPLVWSLHTNRRTKVAVTGMVLLGSVSVPAFQACRKDRMLTGLQSFYCQSGQNPLFYHPPS